MKERIKIYTTENAFEEKILMLTQAIEKQNREIDKLKKNILQKKLVRERDWLNQKEAAAYLHVSVKTFVAICNKLKSKQIILPGFSIGEGNKRLEYRFSKAQLNEIVERYGSISNYSVDRMKNVA